MSGSLSALRARLSTTRRALGMNLSMGSITQVNGSSESVRVGLRASKGAETVLLPPPSPLTFSSCVTFNTRCGRLHLTTDSMIKSRRKRRRWQTQVPGEKTGGVLRLRGGGIFLSTDVIWAVVIA